MSVPAARAAHPAPPGTAPPGGPLRAEVTVVRAGFELQADLAADPGQVVGVIGPNGAGKSTLLRTLAGLVPLDRGRIEVAGRVWAQAGPGANGSGASGLSAQERRVGVVFQDYRLFPHLSVLDNVAFGPRARGATRRHARARAGAELDRVGLGDLARRRPGRLSGGQAQRVALARALAADPHLLLLDEPLAALDARTRLELRGQLRRRLTAFTGPTVLVTHDPIEAMVLVDRLLVLEGGRVVQRGAPAEVARRPATQYVARLVGLNLYPGRMVDPARGEVALAGGGRLFAAGGPDPDTDLDTDPDTDLDPDPDTDLDTDLDTGDEVLVRLAPSAISVFPQRPDASSARNVWPGRISGIERLGDRVRLAVAGSPDALVDITPAALAELELHQGCGVWLSAKATEVTAYGQDA